MAGTTVATWVKVKTKSGFTSRPISHKYEGGASYEPGQVITMSEYQKLKAEGNQKRDDKKTGEKVQKNDSKKSPIEANYEKILSVPKDIKNEVELLLTDSLRGGALWESQKKRYEEIVSELSDGTFPKGYESHYRGKARVYDFYLKNEQFILSRRKAIESGDYKTPLEASLYLRKKVTINKEYDYFDSPSYKKEYNKLRDIFGDDKVPPPLSGKISFSDLKQNLGQGDSLLIREDVYGLGSNKVSGSRIVPGGSLIKLNRKNAKVEFKGEYMGKPFTREGNVPLSDITHVIKDGKRYKVTTD